MITQRRAERPPLSAARRSRLALGLAMGKKSRAVPGRRPILQLSPPGPRSSTPGRDPEPEPDAEPDSTAAASTQPVPAAAPPSTTSAVTTAAAAPDDSPSEGEGAREAAGLSGEAETRARGLRPRPVGQGPGRKRNRGGRRPHPRPAAWRGPAGGRLWPPTRRKAPRGRVRRPERPRGAAISAAGAARAPGSSPCRRARSRNLGGPGESLGLRVRGLVTVDPGFFCTSSALLFGCNWEGPFRSEQTLSMPAKA